MKGGRFRSLKAALLAVGANPKSLPPNSRKIRSSLEPDARRRQGGDGEEGEEEDGEEEEEDGEDEGEDEGEEEAEDTSEDDSAVAVLASLRGAGEKGAFSGGGGGIGREGDAAGVRALREALVLVLAPALRS